MFIYTGIKRTSYRLGWVADMCPHCRDVRPFHLFSERLMHHVYWIALSHRGTTGHKVRCDACGNENKADITRYNAVERGPFHEVGELAHHTNPMLAQALAMDLPMDEIEDSLRASDPDPASRLVRTLLHHYTWSVKRRNSMTLNASVLFAASFCALTLTFTIIFFTSGAWIGFSIASLLSAIGIYLVFAALKAQGHDIKSRHTRDEIIASAVAMHATADDLREACKRCEMMDVRIVEALGRRSLAGITAGVEQEQMASTTT